MKKAFAFIAFLVSAMVMLPAYGLAADLVGNWGGINSIGTASGSKRYVNLYGAMSGDNTPRIAVLQPFNDESFTWSATDSATGYSGVYDVSRWLSSKATTYCAMANDSSGLDVWLQGTYDDVSLSSNDEGKVAISSASWIDLVQLCDSLLSTAEHDTIDFTNPIYALPFVRFKYVTSGEQFHSTAALDYFYFKLVKPQEPAWQ